MTEDILFSQEQAIGIIRLNRPAALNALTLPMISDLQRQLSLWKADPSIHALVILANPGSAFCAGGDVRWLYHSSKKKEAEQLEFFRQEYRLNHFIHHLGKPYIALMDGVTMGGGVGISLHGSHPVASERFSFAMPETGIGFFPDIGASHLLTRCPDGLGFYLGLTGARLNPKQALQAGLVKYLVHSEQIPELLSRLIQEDLSQDAHKAVDSCLRAYSPSKEPSESNPISPKLLQSFSKATVEEIIQDLSLSKEEQASELIRLLETKSPLSLKVTLEQLKKAKGKSLADCLKMDFTLVQHFIKDNDFYEGVRALLIDKDKNPNWQPSSLDLVTENILINYFEQESELQLDI